MCILFNIINNWRNNQTQYLKKNICAVKADVGYYVFLGMHQVYIENHLTVAYPYIRAENSPTGCTSTHRGFCKML